jgi:hypothetical protein
MHKDSTVSLIAPNFPPGLIGVTLVELVDLVSYLNGPLPSAVCLLQLILKNVIKTQILILSDCLILSRYIFIFHLKNPAALPDKFWARVLVFWTTAFSIIFNVVFFALPGTSKCSFHSSEEIGAMGREIVSHEGIL